MLVSKPEIQKQAAELAGHMGTCSSPVPCKQSSGTPGTCPRSPFQPRRWHRRFPATCTQHDAMCSWHGTAPAPVPSFTGKRRPGNGPAWHELGVSLPSGLSSPLCLKLSMRTQRHQQHRQYGSHCTDAHPAHLQQLEPRLQTSRLGDSQPACWY